jgi:hypothetical protein
MINYFFINGHQFSNFTLFDYTFKKLKSNVSRHQLLFQVYVKYILIQCIIMMYLTQLSLCCNLVHMYFIKFPIFKYIFKDHTNKSIWNVFVIYKVVSQIGI